ncbi:hypothetical protein O6H91_07G048100 [Diphasiastrum complanatum]|uniref:Uncharacterized protein n=1 Tax=Diphasiastrum complanatum TaxID=34168 RepID=A0ACC2D4T8_DIPCM|nr:hypothetical protein O6H91_07G048100 [Diphasiastrum complanatum]
MPLTSATVDAFGIVTLALIVLICCVGVFCVVYVLTFRSKINRRGRFYALRDFNSPWRVRIILVTFAVLWGLTELIRLPLLRRKGWLFHSLRFQWQANLCRLYALFSLGFAEPCFFLTALFLVRGSLREAPFTPRRRWNSKVIAFVLGFCLPVFVLQLLFVVISPALKFHKGYKEDREGYEKIPPYFTRTFLELEANNRRVAACAYPLFSSLVLALFAVSFLIYFLYLGWKMMLVVINRKLQARVYSLVLVVC